MQDYSSKTAKRSIGRAKINVRRHHIVLFSESKLTCDKNGSYIYRQVYPERGPKKIKKNFWKSCCLA